MNCVTLAGDLFNPSGTLTGGARKQGNSVLLRLNALVEAEEELEAHQAALQVREYEDLPSLPLEGSLSSCYVLSACDD